MYDTKITLNGIDFEFDLFDADCMERYDMANKQVLQKAEKIASASKSGEIGAAQSIREQCSSIFAFLDTVFGEGTHKKVFGERVNLVQCLDSYELVVQKAEEQKAALDSRLSKINSKGRRKSPSKK